MKTILMPVVLSMELDDREYKKLIRNLDALTHGQMRPAMQQATGEAVRTVTQESFETESDRQDKPWKKSRRAVRLVGAGFAYET